MKIGKNQFILISGIIGVFLVTYIYMKLIYVPNDDAVQDETEQTSIDSEQDTTPDSNVLTEIKVNNQSSGSEKILASDVKNISTAALDQECKDLGGEMLIKPYPNGNKKNIGCLKYGQLHGKFVAWYESGKLHNIGNYKDGIKNGNFTTWYENGNPSMIMYFIDDLLEGKVTGWHENGIKSVESMYENGISIWLIEWDEDGNQISNN